MTRSIHVFALFFCYCALLAGACGDSEPGDSQPGDTLGSDGSQLDPDVADPADPGPSGDTGPGEPASVDTRGPGEAVTAGSAVAIECVALDPDGVELEIEATGWTLSLEPTAGTTVDGLEVTPTLAGTLEVACQLDEPALSDDSPLVLTVVGGPAASTEASVEPSEVVAGEAASVTCQAFDEFGNETDATMTVSVTPAEDVDVDGQQVSSTVAGEYAVSCAADGVDAEQQTAATWTVTPDEPLSMELAFAPDKLSYPVGPGVTVTGVGIDAHGNAIPDMPVTDIDATPAGHHNLLSNDTKIAFDLEGIYEVSATSVDHPALSASRPLVVDQTPPFIEITAPPRGFVADGVSQVTVEGTVSDNLGEVAWLTVAGEEVALPPEGGPFSVTLELAYSVNILVIQASDPYELVAEVGRSVLWSDGWYALDAPTMESDGVDDGLVAVLGQDFVDDGVHDPTQPNDLATIFGIVLAGLDLAALMPDPLTTFGCIGGDCEVRITDMDFGAPDVSLELIQDGIHLELVAQDVSAVLEITYPCDVPFICANGIGTFDAELIIAEMTLATDLMISVDPATSEVVAEATNTEISLDGLTINALDEDPTGLLDQLINMGIDYIEGALLTVLELALPPLLESTVGDALSEVFTALALSQQFDIPAFVEGGAANTLSFDTELATVAITPQYMRMGLRLLARTVNPVPPYAVPGSVRYDPSCGPALDVPTPPASPMAIGFHDDGINQLLFGLWEGGTLSLTAGPDDTLAFDTSSFGVDIHALTIDALLPLVLDSCNEAGDNLVKIGDLFVDVELTMLGMDAHLALWLQAAAPLDVVATTDDTGAPALGFALGDFDPMIVELMTNTGAFEGDDQAVVDLLKDTLLPMLLDELTSLSIAIPSIDLSSLSDTLPAGTELTPDLQTFGRSGAYLTAEGGLQ